MSLPNYLAKIKSSGVYRFVWDKSVIAPQTAETLRLVVGYSEKGPFNTPVYVETVSDFITIYGNISKRLERKGIYFHRLAIQALNAGPILALNIKPFSEESVGYLTFDSKSLGTLTKYDQVTDEDNNPIPLLDENGNIVLEYVLDNNGNKIQAVDEEGMPIYEYVYDNEGNKIQKVDSNGDPVYEHRQELGPNGEILTPDNPKGWPVYVTKPVYAQQIVYKYNESNLDEDLNATKSIAISNVYDTNRFWALNADLLPSKIVEHADGVSKYVNIVATDTKENSCTIFMRPSKPESYKDITIRQWYASQSLELPEYLFDIQDTNLDNYFMDMYVFRGQFTNELCKNGGILSTYFNQNLDNLTINVVDYTDAFGDTADALDDMASDVNSNFVAAYTGCMIPYFKDANGSYISLDIKFNLDNSKHKMLMKLDESYLEDLTSEDMISALSGFTENNSLYGENYPAAPVYLSGYEYTTIGKKTSEDEMQKKIFGQLKDKGMRTALTNRVDIEYHYLVDTFDSLVSMGCKSELAALVKEKDNAFAILNFPKMSNFVNDKSFKSEINGAFDIKKITNKFSLPSELNGASYAGFYTQLTFSDGTLKNVVPSAALVSNNFMEKWSSRQPYYIVAGPIYGRLGYDGMIGPDYNFGRTDLDVLEPLGVNAIIYVPRKGTYINSNQTAKQIPVSALSKVHIRELVIYLQNEIESLLQSYQWELNTQPLRDTIKAKADAILDTVMNNGGVYAYKNICDSSNNTSEIIDNEMIVLDTEIEPARGAGKMVHQLTIHKTGGMTSKIS